MANSSGVSAPKVGKKIRERRIEHDSRIKEILKSSTTRDSTVPASGSQVSKPKRTQKSTISSPDPKKKGTGSGKKHFGKAFNEGK